VVQPRVAGDGYHFLVVVEMATILSLIWWWVRARLGRVNYDAYLRSRAWRFRRKLRRWLDRGRCRHRDAGRACRGPLHCHHKTYVRLGAERMLTDLVTLCKAHHEQVHGRTF